MTNKSYPNPGKLLYDAVNYPELVKGNLEMVNEIKEHQAEEYLEPLNPMFMKPKKIKVTTIDHCYDTKLKHFTREEHKVQREAIENDKNYLLES